LRHHHGHSLNEMIHPTNHILHMSSNSGFLDSDIFYPETHQPEEMISTWLLSAILVQLGHEGAVPLAQLPSGSLAS
jgi:hypothetical protein